MMANDVGITQLTVPNTHPQPYFDGLNRTLLSTVRNFHRQSQ
jgi:hypothetical protein